MELISAYRVPYDPFPVLKKMDKDYDGSVNELWENLYHQGDVDTASYASVPGLVDRGELSLVAAIEVARQEAHNPEIPSELMAAYNQALVNALSLIPTSEEQYQGFYIIHASLNGQYRLAKTLHLLSVEEIINEYE